MQGILFYGNNLADQKITGKIKEVIIKKEFVQGVMSDKTFFNDVDTFYQDVKVSHEEQLADKGNTIPHVLVKQKENE
jgi:hypothetical protein